jgi:glycosyltransferase involved in cell wall biosynthesis
MKILHAAETIKGGIASYLEEVLPYQINDFGRGGVLVLVPDGHADCLSEFADNIVTFSRKSRGIAGLWHFVLQLIKTLNKKKPEVVFFHSTFAGLFGRIILFIYRQKFKVIYCPHGWSFAMKTSNIKNKIYRFIEMILANYATDKVICISKHEYKLAIEAGINEEKIALIYNGITPPEVFTNKNPETNRPVEILFVGRFDYAKGFDILCAAIKNIDTRIYNLTVIGGAIDGEQQLDIPANVNYLGWLPRQQVLEYICKTDVLVMPSRWEGFSMLALEAMACGTAIFASTEASLPEQIAAKVTGELFDISDTNSLKNLIIEANINRLHEMGLMGRIKYLENFTAKTMNESFNRLL